MQLEVNESFGINHYDVPCKWCGHVMDRAEVVVQVGSQLYFECNRCFHAHRDEDQCLVVCMWLFELC